MSTDNTVLSEAGQFLYETRMHHTPWRALSAGMRNAHKQMAREILVWAEKWQIEMPPEDLPSGRMILVKWMASCKVELASRGIVGENGQLGWLNGDGFTLKLAKGLVQWRYV